MADGRLKKRTVRRKGKDASVDEGEEGSQMQQVAPVKKTAKPPTRRLTRRRTDDTPTVSQPPTGETASANNTLSAPALVVKFVEWATGLGVKGLADMFNKELMNALPPTKPAPAFEVNADKNRYQDVVCLEETRVKLTKENPTDTDYIHANWVRFKDHDRTYIATQGPLETTVEDFWRMIWQEQAPIVVNLTTCCEGGKAKCCQYWPEAKDGAYKQFGRFTISVKKVEVVEDNKLFIFVLEVLPEGCSNSLIVRMLHTTAWPDGSVMHSSMAVLRLIQNIFKVDTLAKGPVVIHCSAGIGRTGTLVLIDYILYSLFCSKQVSLKDAFLQLRAQRASSIQRESQFIFVVVAIVAYIGVKHPQFKEQWKAMELAFNNRIKGITE